LLGSAHPVDVAFQMCLDALEAWARAQNKKSYEEGSADVIHIRYESMCVVIADECDGPLKKQMLQTFRSKRDKTPFHSMNDSSKRLFHIHDSMYFGDSKDSTGLQVADAANWAMHRYLRGDALDQQVVEQLTKVSICAKNGPNWTAYRQLFKDHADVSA